VRFSDFIEHDGGGGGGGGNFGYKTLNGQGPVLI